ncbi:MAG: hypothetical protein QXV63_02965 [Candidatus Aenigmatarchaeota archaeon]
MISESVRYGIDSIFNKEIFLFSLLLHLPFLFFLIIFNFAILEYFSSFISLFYLIFLFLYTPIIFTSLVLASHLKIKRKKIEYKKIIRDGIKNYYLRVFLVHLILYAIIFLIFLPSILLSLFFSIELFHLWIIAFIINSIFGIYIFFRIFLAPFATILDKKKVRESFSYSWKISKGNVLRLFLIYIIGNILFFVLGFMLIGFFTVIFKNPLFNSVLLIIISSLYSIYVYFSFSYSYLKFLKRKIKK